MAQNEIDLSGMSPEQLEDLIQKATKQKGAALAHKTMAVMAAWKAAHKWLKENAPEDLGKAFSEINQQMGPRETNVMKKYNMSETQRDNAIERGEKAISGL